LRSNGQIEMKTPFLRGLMPIRTTLYWLEKGDLKLRDQVRILCLAFDQDNKDHEGAREFEFWHWNQLQYRNLEVQLVRHEIKPPSPFIQAFLENGDQVLIDIDGHDRGQIYERVKKVLGKTKLVMEQEKLEQQAVENVANFGYKSLRQCICEVQGQQPCSTMVDPPQYLKLIWRINKRD